MSGSSCAHRILRVAIAVLLCGSPAARAAGRVALVVGNDHYEHAGALVAAESDAELVAESLRASDFQVDLVVNADLSELREAVARFEVSLRGADVGLFYYSGHGVQYQGENYLIPVDADLSDPAYLDAQTLSMGRDLLGPMGRAGAPLNLVFLDACRNNPFAKRWISDTRAVERVGLAQVSAGPGFVIGYATSPGQVALDGRWRLPGVVENGPYAQALVAQMSAPGNELQDLLRGVYDSVRDATHGAQVPWNNQAIGRVDFYFAEAGAGPVEPPQEIKYKPPIRQLQATVPPLPRGLALAGGAAVLVGASAWTGAAAHWGVLATRCADAIDEGVGYVDACPDDLGGSRARDQAVVYAGVGLSALGLAVGGTGAGLWFSWSQHSQTGGVGLGGTW